MKEQRTGPGSVLRKKTGKNFTSNILDVIAEKYDYTISDTDGVIQWAENKNTTRTDRRPINAGKLVWNEEDWRWVDGQQLDQNSYSNWMDVSKIGMLAY